MNGGYVAEGECNDVESCEECALNQGNWKEHDRTNEETELGSFFTASHTDVEGREDQWDDVEWRACHNKRSKLLAVAIHGKHRDEAVVVEAQALARKVRIHVSQQGDNEVQ